MELEVTYQNPGNLPWGPAWGPHYVFEKSFNLLKEKYPDISFTHINPLRYNSSVGFPSPAALTIVNPTNKKRIILSYTDNSRFILYKDEYHGWLPDTMQQLFCLSDIVPMRNAVNSYKTNKDVQVFHQIGSNEELSLDLDLDKIIQPLNQVVYFSHFDLFEADEIYMNRQSAINREQKMLFRGMFHNSRQPMAERNTHREIEFTQERLIPAEYGKELINYRCGLSLNGVAEISNRDLELMAVGMPIIRPLFKNIEFHEPLIPNVHYIPYDYERHINGIETGGDAPLNHNYDLQVTALVDKWEEVKNNYEFLDYVGNNAREWYLRNGRLDMQVKIFTDLCDIHSLQ